MILNDSIQIWILYYNPQQSSIQQCSKMEGSNKQFDINAKRQSTKQSAIILSTQLTHNHPSTPQHHTKRNLAASTFIDYNEYNSQKLSASRSVEQLNDLQGRLQQMGRQKSMRHEHLRPKAPLQSEKQNDEHINNNYIRLKVEEMAFKFKTKIATLLKEIAIPATDLAKYASLNKIDDMLYFLSEKIKQKLCLSQNSESNTSRLREREKEMVEQLSQAVEGLRKKLQEKQGGQKQLKGKLKESHNEIKQLYDKINNKQRQISIKTTELYQNKVIIQEHLKYIATLEHKHAALEKQYELIKATAENGHKSIYAHCSQLEQRERQYQQEIAELKQNITMIEEKQRRLLSFNKGISEEVERWRQRFQSQRLTNGQQRQVLKSQEGKSEGSEGVVKPNAGGKHVKEENKSIRNYNVQENNQLMTVISIHEQEIAQLKNEIAALKLQKRQYELLLAQKRSRPQQQNGRSQEGKQAFSLQTRSQLEEFYRKKMEEMSAEWREKLIQIVDSYTVEESRMKIKGEEIQRERRQIEKKVFLLANQKYNLQCKMIQREDEIYRLNRQISLLTKNQELKRKESLKEQQMIGKQSLKDIKVERAGQSDKSIGQSQSEQKGSQVAVVQEQR